LPTIAIIGILVLAWVAFLAPTLLRARNNQVRADSVGDFHHRLRALGRTNGHRWHPRTRSTSRPIHGPVSSAPAAMTPAQRRRRDVLLVLVALVVVTLIAAIVLRSTPVIALQLFADIVFGAYVYLLVEHKRRTQRRRVARPLAGAPRPEPRALYSPIPTYPAYPTSSVRELDLRGASSARSRLVPLRHAASG
jgi:hypothetical protein